MKKYMRDIDYIRMFLMVFALFGLVFCGLAWIWEFLPNVLIGRLALTSLLLMFVVYMTSLDY